MPASFFNISGEDIFSKSSGGAQHLVVIPLVDEIIGANGLAIYDSVSVQTTETLQYFMTFDDIIKFVHFGKGIGSLSVEGTLFSDCDGGMPGLAAFKGAAAAWRGRLGTVSIGAAVLRVVLTGAQLQLAAEPDTTCKFSFNFSIVDHNM